MRRLELMESELMTLPTKAKIAEFLTLLVLMTTYFICNLLNLLMYYYSLKQKRS